MTKPLYILIFLLGAAGLGLLYLSRAVVEDPSASTTELEAVDEEVGQLRKLAGIPAAVLDTARGKLAELETAYADSQRQSPDQLSIFDQPRQIARHAVLDALHAIDPDDITPKQALAKLFELKEML